MVDFKNIDLFLGKLNEKCKTFLSFETSLNEARDKEIENVTNECDAIIAEMKKKLNQYIDKNFTFIKNTIDTEINFVASFPQDGGKYVCTTLSSDWELDDYYSDIESVLREYTSQLWEDFCDLGDMLDDYQAEYVRSLCLCKYT